MNPTEIIIRVLHLLGAAIALGGAIYGFMVTRRVAPLVPEPDRDAVREAVRKRWAGLFMMSITLLLITGFYNYLMFKAPRHEGQPRYHMVMGIKILLAMVIFFVGSTLVGRAPAFAKFREKAGLWQAVNIVLGITIIVLAGIAHAMPAK